jgi:RNA polymerase sigma factor (sigma-70 family)
MCNRRETNRTEPNRTEPNRTEPNRPSAPDTGASVAEGVCSDSLDWQKLPQFIRVVASRRVPCRELDDLVGETLLQACEAVKRIADAGGTLRNLRALAVQILKRAVCRAHRLRPPAQLVDMAWVPARSERSQDAPLAVRGKTSSIGDQALAGLGRRQREIIRLCQQGMVFAEVAILLKIPCAEVRRIAKDLVRRRKLARDSHIEALRS